MKHVELSKKRKRHCVLKSKNNSKTAFRHQWLFHTVKKFELLMSVLESHLGEKACLAVSPRRKFVAMVMSVNCSLTCDFPYCLGA